MRPLLTSYFCPKDCDRRRGIVVDTETPLAVFEHNGKRWRAYRRPLKKGELGWHLYEKGTNSMDYNEFIRDPVAFWAYHRPKMDPGWLSPGDLKYEDSPTDGKYLGIAIVPDEL